MDKSMIMRFNESTEQIKKLKNQNQVARYNIKNCTSGELLNQYLKSCDIVELHISGIEKELQELHKYLMLLEHQ